MNVCIAKLSSLGDVVHALPVAATLAARLPAPRITWVVEAREAVVLRGHPALSDIVTVDTRRWRRARRPAEVCAAVHGLRGVRARLRAQRFDVALDLQGLLKSALVVALTRAPVRIGFSAGWSREPLATAFSNRRVRPPAAARHVVDQYLALLEPLGLGPPVREFRLPTDPVAESLMDEFLAGAGLKPRDRLVVLNPGAGRPAKRWPLESFTALARRVTDDAGARVVVVWGPGEHAMARAICAGAEGATPAPPTDVPTLLALVRRASVVVASDTGPLHLAAAAGTACVGLYGPTRAERNGPYGGGHRALQSPDGRMAAIGVDAAYRAVTELLS